METMAISSSSTPHGHPFCLGPQKVQSRQEELKERARLLLEQARRDAAMKASNKNNPNSALAGPTRATTACDVSHKNNTLWHVPNVSL